MAYWKVINSRYFIKLIHFYEFPNGLYPPCTCLKVPRHGKMLTCYFHCVTDWAFSFPRNYFFYSLNKVNRNNDATLGFMQLIPLHTEITKPTNDQSTQLYRVSQEERTKLREGVPYVKLYRNNPKHIYPKLNGYGDNGQRSLKLWQLLHTYWLPNSYWNWQEYVVSVMLISVLNIKVTCEWHKAIKLNYKNTHTHITVVLRVTKHCTYRQ